MEKFKAILTSTQCLYSTFIHHGCQH